MRKENGRWNNKTGISIICMLVFIAMVVTSINACGYFGLFGEASWKEEVLLHDGSEIIVKRWQKRGGPHSLDAKPLIQEHSISFKLPGNNKKIIWKDGPNMDIQTANFHLVSLHIKNSIPYLITKTYGCLSFNKWGRPNPPYVIFKYENDKWQRIELTDLPLEFKTVNLVVGTTGHKEEIAFGHGLVTAEKVKELNEDGNKQAEYETIVRSPFEKGGSEGCPEMIYNGHGWMGIDFFNTKASYEECFDECKKLLFDLKYCPCSRLFKNNTKGE